MEVIVAGGLNTLLASDNSPGLRRYSKVPSFGQSDSAIRNFTDNVSEMKKLAARDYEDLLQVSSSFPEDFIAITDSTMNSQCSIPCLEGLFLPEDNETISSLLYIMLSWHALAKLRLHSEITLALLKKTTVLLGKTLRKFQKEVCPHYATFETPRESQARIRAAASTASETVGGKKTRTFNMLTSKLHALGDYADEIVSYGPTDIYSTQLVSSPVSCLAL